MKKTKTVAKAAGKPLAASAGKSSGRAAGGASGPDLDLIRSLAQVITDFDLAELEVEPSGRIRLSRRTSSAGIGAALGAAHAAPPPAAAVPAAAAAPAVDDGVFIMSPFVGTFYRSPSPEAGPFVDAGQAIRKGQVVCIIEAMKLMNEIESEVDGTVVDVLVNNGEHVEYGQKLFRVRKS